MVGWEGRLLLRALAALVSVVAIVWLALWYFIPAPPTTITIAVGNKGGAFDNIAERYRKELALRKVTLNTRYTGNVFNSRDLINDPKSGVDAALLFAGTTDAAKSPDLVSLGRINNAPYWIFYRGSVQIDRLTQLKGKRVIVSLAGRVIFTRLFALHGITAKNTTIREAPGVVGSKALIDGEADVVFLPPQDIAAPEVQLLLHTPDIRLVSLAQADAFVRLFPTLNRLVLPQGVLDLEKGIPVSDVNLIASSDVLVVRKELHPEMINLLAEMLQHVHGGAGIFQRAGEFPTQNDPEFPVAEEAVDFYKNGPSFLQRYLPFWMINYAKRVAAILVAAVAVIIPLFTYAPRTYDWLLQSHLKRVYRRLRAIEDRLQGNPTAAEVMALQGDVDNISRAARILPLRHSDLFFPLIMHIDLVRARLASHLAALERKAA